MEKDQLSLHEYEAAISSDITEVINSGHVTKPKKIRLNKILTKIGDNLALFRRLSGLVSGLTSLCNGFQDGSLLQVTKGYTALEENFDELLQQISQLPVLRDLASKAYSKGLITQVEKDEAFTGGASAQVLANNFLELIRSRIKRDVKAYNTFLGILASEAAYESLFVLAGGTADTLTQNGYAP